MKKFLAMMAVVATVMPLASCSQEKSIYQEQTKYLPVVLQGSNKWSQGRVGQCSIARSRRYVLGV